MLWFSDFSHYFIIPTFHFSGSLGYRSKLVQPSLMNIYRRFYRTYGPRHWWPGETDFEVMVGAILTQNTSWRNVEKAIQKLKEKQALSPEGIRRQ